ncbi:neuronal acetylcholine receptor subunit alpha-3 [Plakobranchus ocellatus]|uniref:Neuronal acetylcholine receptor subunit alpha-3 n=1 Tax=Plakobranchus ocellatus TaxID=259542 RepID=A0AAV3ZV24_9GAST|nr:neuronal acetylcholine receptor subunit alpha-3 [Plakobranchus ocellatus]
MIKGESFKAAFARSPNISCTTSQHRTDFSSPTSSYAVTWLRLTLCIVGVFVPVPSHAGNYTDMKSIHDSLLTNTNYNPDIRPLVDQETILRVGVAFELVSIVEINDVVQRFLCNGFLYLTWTDEVLQWDPATVNGVDVIAPKPKAIFRPRMVLLNTLGERDLFEDDYAPVNVYYNGSTSWIPGGIFPASCKLDLTNYPFDKQICEIKMAVMSYSDDEILFYAIGDSARFTFFTQNGEWDVESSDMSTPNIIVLDSNVTSIAISSTCLGCRPVHLSPYSHVLMLVFPPAGITVLLALTLLTQCITVLLALTVSMSIMSGMLPRSSESMPLVISYIFILMTISVLTVVDSVIIVRLHHMEEREERAQRAGENFKSALPRIKVPQNAVSPLEETVKALQEAKAKHCQPSKTLKANEDGARKKYESILSGSSLSRDEVNVKKGNKYKQIGKHIDMISFMVFGILWVAVTLGFMITVST